MMINLKNKKDPIFLMLVGIPSSGKTTIAREFMNEFNCIDAPIVHLSSDSLREELLGDINNQDNNKLIFDEMEKRTIDSLKENKHVIYDATNINRKKRKNILNKLPKNTSKIACYMANNYDDILERNKNRDRTVPDRVILQMYKRLQLPVYGEGWDNIIHVFDNEMENSVIQDVISNPIRIEALTNKSGYDFITFLSIYFNEFLDILDLPHDSKYHSLSVSRHTYYTYRYILDNYDNKDVRNKEILIWSALLHDLGKAKCKSFINRNGEEARYANFINHEYVSAQIAVNILYRLGFNDMFIYEVSTLVQYHMRLLNENVNKQKIKNELGEDLFKLLEILREADMSAH